MAFCTKCGAPVSGRFCVQCGTPVATSAPPDAPPQAAAHPLPTAPMPPAAASAPKKRGPLIWILAGCFGLLLIAGVLVVSTGWYLAYKAKQAGLDPELMQKNPGMAVAKLVAAVHPDIEVISIDDSRGIIKVRDKKTGKALTMDLAEAKNGKIVFMDDKDQKLELQTQGQGDNASLEIRGADGTMTVGASAGQLPAWIPSYPGAEGAGQFGISGKDANMGSYAFKTNDSPEKVASFFEEALKKEGFEVLKPMVQVPGQASLSILSANDEASKRSAQITIGNEAGATTVSIIFSLKK